MNSQKPIIPGVILIFSCHKHIQTRLKEQTILEYPEINHWIIYSVLGNPFLESEYKIEKNRIYLKCEDSYLHVLKKVVMAMKVVMNIYDIQEGILRCGDDLIFEVENIKKFLSIPNKENYIGITTNQNATNKKKIDNFMPQYFSTHMDDLQNPINGLENIPIDFVMSLNQTPDIPYNGGVIVYFSKDSCIILIEHMETIQWDVLRYYKNDGFPYIIEDVGVGYILNLNRIMPIYYPLYNDSYDDFMAKKCKVPYLACHTNKYK